MQTRIDYNKVAPGSVHAMYKLQKYVDASGLEHSLLELVKTRLSPAFPMSTAPSRRGKHKG